MLSVGDGPHLPERLVENRGQVVFLAARDDRRDELVEVQVREEVGLIGRDRGDSMW